MPVKSILLFVLVSLLSYRNAASQCFNCQTNYGIVGGYNSSIITNLSPIIINEPYFINGITYHLTPQHVPGFDLGAFINFEFNKDIRSRATALEWSWFINLESRYAGNSSELDFSNPHQYFYKMRFNYQYANFVLAGGVTRQRFTGGIGIQFGINAAPNNIVYTSWGPGKLDAFGTDIEQQQQLRNVLYGKNNFGLVITLGYEICQHVDLEARSNFGFKNIVEVQPNSYNFTNQTNHNNTVALLLKIYIERDRP